MPAGGFEFVYIFSLTYICARFPNARTWCIQISCAVSLLGGILVLALPYSNKGGLLAGYYIVCPSDEPGDGRRLPVFGWLFLRYTHTPVQISFYSHWLQPILRGILRRLSSMAWHWPGLRLESKPISGPYVRDSILTLYSIAAPQFYKASQAPRYGILCFPSILNLLIVHFTGLGIGSLCVSLGLCLITYTILCFYLIRENKKREPARIAAMQNAPENIEFLDLTDKENPLFVYVYWEKDVDEMNLG